MDPVGLSLGSFGTDLGSQILDDKRQIKQQENEDADQFHVDQVIRPGRQRIQKAGSRRLSVNKQEIGSQQHIDRENDCRVDIQTDHHPPEGSPGWAEILHSGHVDPGGDQ